MNEIIYNSEYASVDYDETSQFIELVWKKDSDSEEYRKIFKAILDFSDRTKVKSLLSDMRQQGLVRHEDVRWLDKEILTEAIERRLERIALVIKESVFSSVYADAIKKKLQDTPIQLQIFDDISAAKSWLISE